jgi:hypothetical protein
MTTGTTRFSCGTIMPWIRYVILIYLSTSTLSAAQTRCLEYLLSYELNIKKRKDTAGKSIALSWSLNIQTTKRSPFQSGATYRNVSIDHSHSSAVYHPGKRCSKKFLFWCTKWFEAWSWQTVGPQSALRSYRSTFAGYLENEDPFVSFSFRGMRLTWDCTGTC